MKQRIIITVEMADSNKPGSFKQLFQVVNVIDDAVNYDYVSVYKGLKLLFPDEHTFVTFKIG